MKIDPHLPQLPSIAELLEHPRVQGVVNRINRSTVAQRAAGFLDELRSSLAKRTGLEAPSIAHLAERLVRRLLGESTTGAPLVNATGLVVGDPDLAPPSADAAVHAMMHVASEYHGRQEALVETVERQLTRLTGAEAARLVSSYDAALTLLLSATAEHREVALHGPAVDAGPTDWHWIATRAGVVLRPAGHETAAIPKPAAPPAQLAAVVQSVGLTGSAPDGADAPVAALAKHGACQIVAAPWAGILDPARHGLGAVATLSDHLKRGADVVVADGSGLLGGPACGILLGKRSFIEAAARHPLASLLTIPTTTAAALQATLAVYSQEKDENAAFTIPVWQLLSTPEPNLQQRAERLAPLMNESPLVLSAEAQPLQSPWIVWGTQSLSSQSWAISLKPRSGDAAALVERLHQCSPAIMARHNADAVLFDLRSVFPRWDQQLVAAVDGRAATAPDGESVQAL